MRPYRFSSVCLLLLTISFGGAQDSQPKRIVPWDVPALSKAPPIHETKDRPAKGLESFFYEGAGYKGKPTYVFAYYGEPQGTPPPGGWPAVVCAHGGGGTAYPGWVREWNRRGYAALAMDLEGHLPGGKDHGVEGNLPLNQGHVNAGPARIDYFGDRDLPDAQQWFHHAVADVIRANSLLRAKKSIDPDKIGLTGISWGGTIVSAVAGVDPRFAFVVPVYGCGFIHESDNPGLAQWFPPKNMTAEQFQNYRSKYDPSIHLPHAKMPMLFVTGVGDPVFQIDIVAKSAKVAGNATMSLRPFLPHGHGNGWQDAPEIYAFADSVVKAGPPLPKLDRPQIGDGNVVTTKVKGNFSEAWLYYCKAGTPWKNVKAWKFIKCEKKDDHLVATEKLPADVKAFFVYVFRTVGAGRDNHAASELVILDAKKK